MHAPTVFVKFGKEAGVFSKEKGVAYMNGENKLAESVDSTRCETLQIKKYESGQNVYLTGDSERSAIGYKPGETVKFRLATYADGEPVDGLYIKYAFKYETDEDARKDPKNLCLSEYAAVVECKNGECILEYVPKEPGFGYIEAVAAIDSDGTLLKDVSELDGSDYFRGGFGVGIESIGEGEAAPLDFEDFWKRKTSTVNSVCPEVLETSVITEDAEYTVYIVKISAVDDSAAFSDDGQHSYASLIASVPNDRSRKYPVEISYMSHGVRKIDLPSCSGDKINLRVSAHSMHPYSSEPDYYKTVSSVLAGYENKSFCGQSYFINMLLRDYQVVRWVRAYFGEGGLGIFDGDIILQGGSQGGFQAAAVAGLCSMNGIAIKGLEASIVWNCNLSAHRKMNVYHWHTVYNDLTKYIDPVYFAPYIECPLKATARLGDYVAPPSSVTALYNAFTRDKTISYFQNSSHGTVAKDAAVYTKSDKAK